MRATLKSDVDIPWTSDNVKNHLWKPIQKALTGHESTTKPKTGEYGQVYDVLSRHLGEKLGVFVEWPSKDNV